MKKLLCLLSLLAGGFLTDAAAQPFIASPSTPVTRFLDQLPLLPRGDIQAGQFSSHSPHQQNGDSGHFLYTDEQGDAVLFDAIGPGCITNIWGTVLDPEGILKFYFDGEDTPRYTVGLIDFFKGAYPDFPLPFNSYDRRGYYIEESMAGNSFFPIPFEKSLKISLQGNVTFYHILYEKYPLGTPLDRYTGTWRNDYIRTAFETFGQDPWKGGATAEQTTGISLAPRQSADLLKVSGAGAVRSIEIEMDARNELLRNLRILMLWDDATAAKPENTQEKLAWEANENSRLYHVNAPVGYFFGSPHDVLDLKSLPLVMTPLEGGRVRLQCFFVMPYWDNARITLFNKSDIPAGNITARITTTAQPYPRERTGYFTTRFREGMTEYGRDWLFAESPGAGWFLGVVQSCRLEHYCEGNEHFYMDGNRSPQINGTGTEDYYLACFWPNLQFNTPFAGCAADVRILGGGDPNRFLVCLPTDYTTAAVYYRFHLDMPLPFYNHINARIQHGGESQIESEYGSIAYLYLKPTPMMRQTDYIDVTNPASMKAHAYETSGKPEAHTLTARYEGDYLYTHIRDAGYYHRDGSILFTVAIDAENNGVRLRRRIDQATARQKAEVYIDGEFAGTWYDPQSNPLLRWYDTEFNIHPNLTRGKQSLHVKLIVSGKEEYNYTDFEYTILCHNP